jgi:hypothetical protein
VDFDGPTNTLKVTQIFSSDYAFAALRSDGSVVTWGNFNYGGDSSGVDYDGPNNDLQVVAFADPFTDDRLVIADPLPSVSLVVSPAMVSEDGSGNLVYSFSRTGSTSDALTVNYTLSGSASLGADYTGIAVTPATKSIIFAAGAATAQVIVNPIPDTTSEANETVLLSIAPGSGYSIGTATVVTGTIRNDDIIGTNANNTLVGTDEDDYIFGGVGLDSLRGNGGNDRLAGGAGADTLTGGAGTDTFLFQFRQSTLTQYDRITDFAIGVDRLDLLTTTGAHLPPPTTFSRARNTAAVTLGGVVASAFTDANGATAGNQPLAPNTAALVVATAPTLAGTYLVINDGVAGFQSGIDLVVNITGKTGSLPAPGTIPVSTWFA